MRCFYYAIIEIAHNNRKNKRVIVQYIALPAGWARAVLGLGIASCKMIDDHDAIMELSSFTHIVGKQYGLTAASWTNDESIHYFSVSLLYLFCSELAISGYLMI